MPKRIKHIPNGGIRAEPPALGILELERFSTQDLKKWDEASTGLDELAAELYFGVEAKRRKFRHQLIESIQGVGHTALPLDNWVRIVTYQYSLEPLTCAGSLQAQGGRFNAGCELDANTMRPWPALYLAQNFETAFREKFQLTSDDLVDGLTPQELSLEGSVSHTTVFVNGHLQRVFDMSAFTSLTSVAKILRKIKMPAEAVALAKQLKIGRRDLSMITTGPQLFNAAVKQNWRITPSQFGLPAPSHILGELIRDAGFEAILYPSSKGPGKAPSGATVVRLDPNTAATLEGWESIPRQFR